MWSRLTGTISISIMMIDLFSRHKSIVAAQHSNVGLCDRLRAIEYPTNLLRLPIRSSWLIVPGDWGVELTIAQAATVCLNNRKWQKKKHQENSDVRRTSSIEWHMVFWMWTFWVSPHDVPKNRLRMSHKNTEKGVDSKIRGTRRSSYCQGGGWKPPNTNHGQFQCQWSHQWWWCRM